MPLRVNPQCFFFTKKGQEKKTIKNSEKLLKLSPSTNITSNNKSYTLKPPAPCALPIAVNCVSPPLPSQDISSLNILGYNCRSLRTGTDSFNSYQLHSEVLESPSDWDIVLLVETWARTDGVKLTNGNYDILQNLVTSDIDDSDDPTLNRRARASLSSSKSTWL